MTRFPKPIEELIDRFGMLPGVGPKTAERFVFSLLKRSREDRQQLSQAIEAIDGQLTTCSVCRNYTEADPCVICADPRRERNVICVVANEQDLLAVESTREHHGLYHILGGVLSPADGITPDELTVRELQQRIRQERPDEIILAFDPTIEGESTILYLTRLLDRSGARLTRLARGLPPGSELHYADEVTLSDALKGRRDIAPSAVPSRKPAAGHG
ncbi:recombination protein RecR [Parcubacteria bacterium SG8_24]|nr:MAG: recombination protein RecR [Parcubacteria bacterium SG8_24]